MLDQRRNPRAEYTKAVNGRAAIRPVSQVILRLDEAETPDQFNATIKRILQWMNKRAGGKLPAVAWECGSFDLSAIGTQRTSAVVLNDPKYWAARLDDADRSVPLRTWVTEIGVGVDPQNRVLFGCRLICVTRGEDVQYDRSVPGFVKHILSASAAKLDGIPVQPAPWIVKTEADVAQLVHLLESPDRQSDVVVFSLPEGSTNPRDAAASAFEVYGRVQGAAHVCVITGPASFYLTERVGRELSVYRQRVRTYKPGFRGWVDQPSNHPLATAETIQSWRQTRQTSFENWLVNQILGDTVYGQGRSDRLPSFNAIRQLALKEELEKLKASGGSENELLQLFERDNEELRRELKEQKEEYDGLLETADLERKDAVREANAAKQQAFERLIRIRALEQLLSESEVPKTPVPNDLENFEQWCRTHLAGTVELANRAYQGVRKSEFHSPALLYDALLLLRDFYVPMRVEPSSDRRQCYETRLKELNLEESFTGEGVRTDGDLYSAQYGGRKLPLDKHLKGGNSRDRKYQFRLYFCWDEEDQVVVVGWLPSHLDNRMS